ncbi:histidine phosphatase family protein [Stutzerimonas kirkiae]|uniref:Histidine phosphatase family protein n=2 Tax=Stutzerimonas kirkiae TaxID=2211392 RepID=A0A4Q9QX81_9GAMM|nr:histidine phosphatase family protein [Stutzerimonas kirkiae]TBU99020.1 histidine phosphatase family protein [Stutzerimonas kirkiae]
MRICAIWANCPGCSPGGNDMRLLVIRHGQTAYNLEQRYLGALDPPLNATGIRQAEALRDSLPGDIDILISSPLLRARQSARILAQGRPVEIEEAFRERHVGVFEGLTSAEAQARFPEAWQRNITRQWQAAPEGGETIAAVFERVGQGLERLLRRDPQATVALVAHGFVAKVIRAIALGDRRDLFDWQLDNAQYCELQPSLPLARFDTTLNDASTESI